jgi:hypothetical protein
VEKVTANGGDDSSSSSTWISPPLGIYIYTIHALIYSLMTVWQMWSAK